MSLDELWSRLKGLRVEKLRSLSPESLVRVLGFNPRELPLGIKMELARRLYDEYGFSQRWIASRLRMSLRDVSRALKSKEGLAQTPTGASSMLRDPEVVAKAIRLVREGRARNPNNLVLELRISLDDAEKLYMRIVENEGLTNVATVEAIVKIAKYVRGVERRSLRVEELFKELSVKIEEAKTIKEELVSICNKAVKNVETLKWLVKDLDDYILGFRTLPPLQETLEEFLEMRDKLKELEKRVNELEKHIAEDKEMKDKHRFKIQWNP